MKHSFTWLAMLSVAIMTAGCDKNTDVQQGGGGQEQPVNVVHEPNPTTDAGRGDPSLTSLHAPAAWIYVDGMEGEFNDENGHPQIQWTIFEQTTRNPTFRVEEYKPLIKGADCFQCVLRTHESFDGSAVLYTIVANDGEFEAGKEYALLDPGSVFTVTDHQNGTTIQKIPLLSPGVYSIVASIKNQKTNREALAVTHFTVGSEEQ